MRVPDKPTQMEWYLVTTSMLKPASVKLFCRDLVHSIRRKQFCVLSYPVSSSFNQFRFARRPAGLSRYHILWFSVHGHHYLLICCSSPPCSLTTASAFPSAFCFFPLRLRLTSILTGFTRISRPPPHSLRNISSICLANVWLIVSSLCLSFSRPSYILTHVLEQSHHPLRVVRLSRFSSLRPALRCNLGNLA